MYIPDIVYCNCQNAQLNVLILPIPFCNTAFHSMVGDNVSMQANVMTVYLTKPEQDRVS